jgi:hypothetical protein
MSILDLLRLYACLLCMHIPTTPPFSAPKNATKMRRTQKSQNQSRSPPASSALRYYHTTHDIGYPPLHATNAARESEKKKRKEIPRFRLTDRSTLTHIHPSIHSNKPAQRLLVKHLQWCGNVAVGGWLAVEVCIWFSQSVSQLVSQSASQNRQTDTCHPSFPSLESFRFH